MIFIHVLNEYTSPDGFRLISGMRSETILQLVVRPQKRDFQTRLGTIYLLVPKLRNGGYIPFFLQEKKRSETALISLIQEAYVNGVSTRKVERLAKSLGIEGLSATQVSEITKGLDEKVSQWRTRDIDPVYPVLWVDALYEKIRQDGRIVSSAVLIVQGLTKYTGTEKFWL